MKSWKKILPTKRNKHSQDSLESMLALKDLTSETRREIEKEMARREKKNKKV